MIRHRKNLFLIEPTRGQSISGPFAIVENNADGKPPRVVVEGISGTPRNAEKQFATAQRNRQRKQIDWSYPTSGNAERFGFAKGCWTVQVSTDHRPPVAFAGFGTEAEAVTFARSLPMPFGDLWKRYETDATAARELEIEQMQEQLAAGSIRETERGNENVYFENAQGERFFCKCYPQHNERASVTTDALIALAIVAPFAWLAIDWLAFLITGKF